MDKEQITKSLLEGGDGQDAGSGQLERTDLMLATVAAVYADGLTLIFDGETTASQKHYKKLSTYFGPTAGDRVAVMKMSGTYVVMGAIGGSATVPVNALPIVPITKGGTGQNGLTVITDPTEVFTMAPGFECSWVYYAEWGKIAMVSASFKVIDAVTTTDWTTWATLTAGKRPPSRVVASFTRTSYCTVERNGEIQVSSTVNANTTYSFSAVYLLP